MLGPDTADKGDVGELPRYLPVEKFSAYQNEGEWLFGGRNNKLRIKNIYKEKRSCKTAVSALTKMQQLLQNGSPKWKEKELLMIQEYHNLPLALMKSAEQTRRDDLVRLIQRKMPDKDTSDALVALLTEQLFDTDSIENDMDLHDKWACSNIHSALHEDEDIMEDIQTYLSPQKTKEFDDYQLELFKFFFMQTDIRQIEIKNVDDLPDKLRFLFFDDDDKLSLDPISRLLPMVQSVGFTDFKLDDLRQSRAAFIECIKSWAISHDTASQATSQINCIELRSEYQARDDPLVKDLVEDTQRDLENYGWSLKYKFEDNHYHRIIAERIQKFQIDVTNYIIRRFELSLNEDLETLSEISVNERERAIQVFLGEKCGLNALKQIRFSVDIMDRNVTANENNESILKFKMTIFGEKDTLEDDVKEIELILSDENIAGKTIQLESLSIPVHSINKCTDLSLADGAMKEMKRLIAMKEKFEEIRDPLRVTAAEATKPWTEERYQNVVLRRKELQEQQLQMIKNFMSSIESLLKANELQWKEHVLERVEQLRSRKAFRRYFRSLEMDEVKVRNYYSLHEVLQNMFLDDDKNLSLRFICDLLPKLRTVAFIDISTEEMRNHIKDFAGVIVKIKEDGKGRNLKEVDFESVEDLEGTEDDDIRRKIERHKRELNVLRWSLKYRFDGQRHVISMREGDVNAIEAVGGIEEAIKIAAKLKTEEKYKGKRLKAMRGGHYFQMSLGKQCLSLECDAKTVTVDESKEEEVNGPAKTATIHLADDLDTASTFQFEPYEQGATGEYFIYGTYPQDKGMGLIMSDAMHLLGIFAVQVCVVNDDLWFCTIRKTEKRGDKDGGFWFGDNESVQYEKGLSASTKDVFIMMKVNRPRHGCIMQ